MTMRLWGWGKQEMREENQESRFDQAAREALRRQEFSRYVGMCIDEPEPSRRKEIIEEWRQRTHNSTTTPNQSR